MKTILLLLVFLGFIKNLAAQSSFRAVIQDSESKAPLTGATVRYFRNDKSYGVITNNEGRFSIPGEGLDSVKVSMIGYKSLLLVPPFSSATRVIFLSAEAREMKAVVVRSFSAEDIIRKAIENLSSHLPKQDYGNLIFYREMIKDREHYFSVSEALFDAQYYPKQKDFRLALEQGRAKEDVVYTRLFEDYHPGGGPQFMASQSFSVGVPECLQLSKMKDFIYKKDSVSFFDGRVIYVIEFDQRDGVKEAFEKGTVLIDAEQFTVLKYKAANSPKSSAHIKGLTGTDKLMAKLLGIDLQVLSWSRSMDFLVLDSIVYLQFSSYQRHMLYKQPKKGLDLDLSMSLEWMASEVGLPITQKIKEEDVWKRSNLMVNLLTAFASSFWGDRAILSPTDSLVAVLRSISANNKDDKPVQTVEGWQLLNRKFFVAYKQNEQVLLTPTMKSAWDNESTGPFLYKDTTGNIKLSCHLQLVKASDAAQEPDKGFQQGGLMIRNPNAPEQNYVFLALGTGGNPKAKVFFKKTENGKSKTLVNGVKNFSGQLLLEKSNDMVKAFLKPDGNEGWEQIGEYKAPWLTQNIQVGLAGFADFAGNGPKMHPDVNFIFSNVNLQTER